MRIFEKIRQILGNPEPELVHTQEGIGGDNITAGPRNRDNVDIPLSELDRRGAHIYKAHVPNSDVILALPSIRSYVVAHPEIAQNGLPFVVAFIDLQRIVKVEHPATLVFLPPDNAELQQIRTQDTSLKNYLPLEAERLKKLNNPEKYNTVFTD